MRDNDDLPASAFARSDENHDDLEDFLANQSTSLDLAILSERIRRSSPNANNPYFLICEVCGEKQHLENPYCTCGEFIRGQMQNMFWNWHSKRVRELTQLAQKWAKYEISLYLGSWVPLICIIVAGYQMDISKFWLENFLYYWNVSMVLLIAGLALAFHFERRKKLARKKIKELCFIDFIVEEFEMKAGSP